MRGPVPNLDRLRRFVQTSLDRASTRGGPEAAAGLRRDAARVEHELRALSGWAAGEDSTGPPRHLAGLSAFDLSDAMDALQAEARRRAPA